MSRIVGCCKWVADEAGIKVQPDLSLDFSGAQGMISNYDRQVIEEAVQTAKALGMSATGMTLSGESGRAALKDALSRGFDDCVFINTGDRAALDGRATAKALAAEISALGDVSLVICGEGASDTYARQTAPRIGAALDWPVVTSVTELTAEGDSLLLVRKLAGCNETVRVSLPAVISVLPDINQPPLPGLKAIMAAKKKPVIEAKLSELSADISSKTRTLSSKGYIMIRKNLMLAEGEADEKVEALYSEMKKEGLI